MARLEQPSASATAKTPTDSVPENTVRPARTGWLPLAGIVAALAIAAGAYVYYQGQPETGSVATAPQATTSDNTAASAPAGTTPISTQGAASPAQSTTAAPTTTPEQSAAQANAHATATATAHAAPSAHAGSAKPHRIAKASRPARALEPRDRRVALATNPHPVYPLQAMRAGEQGTVVVLAQVNVDGQVTDARVVRHSGSIILDRAAPNEVRRWKFEPALHNGRPVVASVEVPVNYRLNQ